MGDVTQFPYQGTWEELQNIRSEIAKNQAARAHLDAEQEVLQQHQRYVLSLIRASL
jgi:hypothetical protein